MQRLGDAPRAQPAGTDRRAHISATEMGALDRLSVAASARPVRPARSRHRTRGDTVYYVGPNILALEKRFAFRPRDFRLWIALARSDASRAVRRRAVDARALPRSRAAGLRGGRSRSARRLPSHRACARRGRGRAGTRSTTAGSSASSRRPSSASSSTQVQALMSLLEGHGNYVMTELGRRHVAGRGTDGPRVARSAATQAASPGSCTSCSGSSRRCGSTRSASGSCARASTAAGPDAIDRAWVSPDHLPTLAELDDAGVWLGRVSTAFPLRAERPARGRTSPDSSALDDVVAPIVVGCSGRSRLACAARARTTQRVTRRARCTSTTVCVRLRSTTTSSKPRPRGSVPASDAVSVEVAPGGNLEARARDARYAALERVAAEVGAASSPSRHTRDDQAETVLLERPAGERHDRPRRHARAARHAPSARCSGSAGPRPGRSARCCGLAPVHDAMNDDTPVPARAGCGAR